MERFYISSKENDLLWWEKREPQLIVFENMLMLLELYLTRKFAKKSLFNHLTSKNIFAQTSRITISLMRVELSLVELCHFRSCWTRTRSNLSREKKLLFNINYTCVLLLTREIVLSNKVNSIYYLLKTTLSRELI